MSYGDNPRATAKISWRERTTYGCNGEGNASQKVWCK
jgi:hypothetical protein